MFGQNSAIILEAHLKEDNILEINAEIITSFVS